MLFKKSRTPKKTKFMQKSMKNRMFFGTSILRGFCTRFGKIVEGQNPRFSHFFRCFFNLKPIKNDIKSKLRKIVKKARNLKPGPWLPGARPLEVRPSRQGFGGILLKNKRPVQAGSKFWRFGLDPRP